MTHKLIGLRATALACVLAVVGATAASASLHIDADLFNAEGDAPSVLAETPGQKKILTAQWNEKKVRGIVKKYTGSSNPKTGSNPPAGGKKKDCNTITHTNPKVQKKLRQICKYQQ